MNNNHNDEYFDNFQFYQNLDPKLEFEWTIESKAHEKCIQQINLFAILNMNDAGRYIPTYRKCVTNQILYLKRIMNIEDIKMENNKNNSVLVNQVKL